MIAVILSPLYIALNVIIGLSYKRWLEIASTSYIKSLNIKVCLSLFIYLASSLLLGFIFPESILKRIFSICGDYYLGILLFLGVFTLLGHLIIIIGLRSKKFNNTKVKSKKTTYYVGLIVIVATLVCTLGGVINARIIRTTYYDVSSTKTSNLDSLKIVMVADLHMGYNIGVKQISNMVEKINNQNPDVVFIAGDIFDNDYDALDYPDSLIEILKGIKTKYGVYAIHGNHDLNEKVLAGFTFKFLDATEDSRMDEFLEKANITVLQDEGVNLVDNIYVYGRVDYYNDLKFEDKRTTPDEIGEVLDDNNINILLDHQPRELEELSNNKVDLDLSGHTHDGQVFPGNILSSLIYKNSYGLKTFGNMTSIVTSGVGVFGPNMRVGTKAEITVINYKFNQ